MASSVHSNYGRLVGQCLTFAEISWTENRSFKIAQCQLVVPDVAWSLGVTVQPVGSLGRKEVSIWLENVSGPNSEQVIFTSVVSSDEESALNGEGFVIGADGLLVSYNASANTTTLQRYILIRLYDKYQHRISGGKRDLIFDLDKLLQDNVLSDVVLQVQGGDQTLAREFRAHKAVLAARSPVFQRLVQTDMAEAKTAAVKVGFSVEVTELVLRYIYTDKVDFGGAEGTIAMDLLTAADYYQLEGLKDACEAVLLQRVGAKQIDVLETIVFADQCGAAKLKRGVLDFAASNLKELRNHRDWAAFMVDHRSLVDELIGVLAEREATK